MLLAILLLSGEIWAELDLLLSGEVWIELGLSMQRLDRAELGYGSPLQITGSPVRHINILKMCCMSITEVSASLLAFSVNPRTSIMRAMHMQRHRHFRGRFFFVLPQSLAAAPPSLSPASPDPSPSSPSRVP